MKLRNLNLVLIFICIVSVINLQSQIVVIDPGHGYDANGGNPDGRSAIENATALEVGLRLNTLLNNLCTSWTTHMTRSTNNGWISVTQRAAMSNSWNADYYLSIHTNDGGGTGTETFWCDQNDPSSTDDILMATTIQNKMVQHGNWVSRRVVEDGSYIFHLAVLKYSNATGCLNEIGFGDYAPDYAKLNSTTWRDSFALAYKDALENLIGSCSVINTNDYCSNAEQLFSNSTCNYTSGSLLGATNSLSSKPTCDPFSGTPSMKDVFYYFIANSTTHTIEVNPVGTGANAVDAIISVYSGTNCAALTQVGCGGGSGSGSGGSTKYAYLSSLNIGQTYWVRIYDYGTVDPTDYDYQICLTSSVITTGIAKNIEYIDNELIIYPNPSNGIFSISTNSGNEFGYVVLNYLGQSINSGKLNASITSIDLSNQSSGIYFLVTQYKGKSTTYKIIKH